MLPFDDHTDCAVLTECIKFETGQNSQIYFEKYCQTTSTESSAEQLSLQWLHFRISSMHQKDITSLNYAIRSGSISVAFQMKAIEHIVLFCCLVFNILF